MIKKLIFVFILFINYSTYNQTSPCNDPQFRYLQTKPIEKMTENEYDYFKDYNNDCNDFKADSVEKYTDSLNRVNSYKSRHNAKKASLITGIGLSIVTTIVIFILTAAGQI